jgi:predicted nucleic acid-binding protein
VKPAALWDTGPLVALLNARDEHHRWVLEEMSQLRRPLLSCEVVIAEASYLLRHQSRGQAAILEMLAGGVLTTPFRLSEHSQEVLRLCDRYANVPMSLADACLVRMSETVGDSVVVTLDSHFHIYRRHGRQKIPLMIPPDR